MAFRSLLFAFAYAGVVPAATTLPAAVPAAELPLKSVTLYTSGVGFFRHDGVVTGDGQTTLKFKTAQINDVIKSLVVRASNGRVVGVQYPSQDPTDKTLKGFQIDLSNNPSLGELLRQLRGATLTLDYDGNPSHTGVIVGLSKKAVAGPQVAAVESWYVTLLQEGNRLVQLRLDDATAVTLADANLNAELAQALAAVAAGRDQDKKPVTVKYAGVGEHRLSLGYVVETPVWKTTYRLLLGDANGEAKDAGKDKAALQGWAVVENQTDADWDDIALSLVSGRPMGFTMNLYEPLYVQRPTVDFDLFRGLRPQIYAGGTEAAKDTAVAAATPAAAPLRMTRAAKSQLQGGGGRFDANDSVLLPTDDMSDSVRSAAVTAKLGELFQYTIEHVSLPRRQSSLVPIVTDDVAAESVSIFNQGVLPRNPLNGAFLTNTTGKLLPQGPVTVLDGGAYAGDARIEDLPSGQKRLLSFGVDLQTLVDVVDHGRSDYVGGKIVGGVLTLGRRVTQSKKYAAENKADHDKVLIVEHPRAGDGWALVDSPEPMEKADTVYRFRLALPKNAKATLDVHEQHVEAEAVVLADGDPDVLVARTREGALPEKVRQALADAVARRRTLDGLVRQVQDRTDKLAAITVEQQRLRENMQAVDREGAYYKRLLAKLNEQEGAIETLQKDRDALQEKADAARADLRTYLTGLNVG